MKIKVVFWGTPDIGLKSLDYLHNSDKFDVIGVVTQPDRPSGRGHKIVASPINQYAVANNIPVLQPKSIRKEPDIQALIKELNADFFVTFAFGQILPQEILDMPKYETINLHASLLPKYRGANPIQRCIINGDKQTGICTMITELGLDCGDICIKCPIDISETMNCEELYETISEKSPQLIEETLLGIVEGSLTPQKQCEDGVCFANKLTPDEFKIDWSKSAQEIHNLVRGIYKSPSASFIYNDKIVKVLETSVLDETTSMPAGQIVRGSKLGVDFATGDGVLRLIKVKPESKGEMFARDWYNGLGGAKK